MTERKSVRWCALFRKENICSVCLFVKVKENKKTTFISQEIRREKRGKESAFTIAMQFPTLCADEGRFLLLTHAFSLTLKLHN